MMYGSPDTCKQKITGIWLIFSSIYNHWGLNPLAAVKRPPSRIAYLCTNIIAQNSNNLGLLSRIGMVISKFVQHKR